MSIPNPEKEIRELMLEHDATNEEVRFILELCKGYVERMNLVDFLKKHPQATQEEIIDRASFFKMTKEFISCLEEYPPNFAKAKELLEVGVDINFVDYNDEPLISDLIMGYPHDKAMNPCMICDECDTCDRDSCEGAKVTYDSRYLPDVVRFFLENGYDVTKENGKFGAEALYALCWSTYDSKMLDAAKILLDAGADLLYPVADGEDVFGSINWKLSGCVPVNDDLEMECLYTAYYDIAEAKIKGLDYNSIQWWDTAIGKRIDQVISCAVAKEDAVYEFPTGDHKYTNCFKDDIVLVCEGITLVVTHHCHTYVNPCNIPQQPIDLSDKLGSLIGYQIVDVQFSLNEAMKERVLRHGSTLKILLDNGSALVVRDNGDQFGEEYCAWFAVESQ